MMYRNESEDICDAIMVTGKHERVELITDLNLIKDETVK